MIEKAVVTNDQFSLEAKNIKKFFDKHAVIENFSLSISAGQVMGIVGDNGSGKSTIMRIIALVERQDEGTITINLKNATNHIKHFRNQIGYIPQAIGLIEEMSAKDNLKLFSLSQDEQTKIKIEEFAEVFGMRKFLNKKVKKLSGGMKRRVNIAAGLMNSPKLIIADEPFAGLDAKQRGSVIAYFKKLNNEGVAILITSHYIENIKPWADDIIYMDSGRICN